MSDDWYHIYFDESHISLWKKNCRIKTEPSTVMFGTVYPKRMISKKGCVNAKPKLAPSDFIESAADSPNLSV